MLLLALLFSIFAAATPLVAAEEMSKAASDGEPTDPESILSVAAANLAALEEAGLADAPTDEREYESWLQALLELLRSLGLLPGESDS